MARKISRTTRGRPQRTQRTASGGLRYAKVDEAADYIGVDRNTVHQMLADGRLTPYRLGRRVLRVDLNEVDSEMERGAELA